MKIGDFVTIGEQTILSAAVVEDNVRIGKDCIIVCCFLLLLFYWLLFVGCWLLFVIDKETKPISGKEMCFESQL